MNKDSSRSHSLLTLYVKSETVDEVDGRPVPRFGKVVFVDLAGSERLKESQSEGQTKVETGSINKSLFTLGKVIATLSDKGRGKADVHIPYRDSKLTKLLMDSLGGSSMALMVACISPASYVLAPPLSVHMPPSPAPYTPSFLRTGTIWRRPYPRSTTPRGPRTSATSRWSRWTPRTSSSRACGETCTSPARRTSTCAYSCGQVSDGSGAGALIRTASHLRPSL